MGVNKKNLLVCVLCLIIGLEFPLAYAQDLPYEAKLYIATVEINLSTIELMIKDMHHFQEKFYGKLKENKYHFVDCNDATAKKQLDSNGTFLVGEVFRIGSLKGRGTFPLVVQNLDVLYYGLLQELFDTNLSFTDNCELTQLYEKECKRKGMCYEKDSQWIHSTEKFKKDDEQRLKKAEEYIVLIKEEIRRLKGEAMSK